MYVINNICILRYFHVNGYCYYMGILFSIYVWMLVSQYGYAPKGTSVVVYRKAALRHHQYTVTTDWPGGVYGSPTVNGEYKSWQCTTVHYNAPYLAY